MGVIYFQNYVTRLYIFVFHTVIIPRFSFKNRSLWCLHNKSLLHTFLYLQTRFDKYSNTSCNSRFCFLFGIALFPICHPVNYVFGRNVCWPEITFRRYEMFPYPVWESDIFASWLAAEKQEAFFLFWSHFELTFVWAFCFYYFSRTNLTYSTLVASKEYLFSVIPNIFSLPNERNMRPVCAEQEVKLLFLLFGQNEKFENWTISVTSQKLINCIWFKLKQSSKRFAGNNAKSWHFLWVI